MKTESGTAIVVLSCDKYADAWLPFFTLFRKFWPDCKFPVYLGTNEQSFEFPGVRVIQSGKALNWSDDTRNMLLQIPEKYIIVLLEDYFIEKTVDLHWLEKCLDFTREKDAAFMRIASFRKDHFPMYAYDILEENAHFGTNRKETNYRVNLQAAIWNKNDFLELIKPGESPWEFEVNASKRTIESKKQFLCITESSASDIIVGPIPYLCTAITKGTWMREAIDLCKKENIALDLSVRPIESGFALARRKMYHALPFWTRKYLDFISGKIS